MLGVSADYLLGDFGDDARDAAQNAFHHPTMHGIDTKFPVQDPSNPNFYELKGLSHKGRKAKGLGKECPRDGRMDCSIVDALDATSKAFSSRSSNPEISSQAGRMSHFLSWTCESSECWL